MHTFADVLRYTIEEVRAGRQPMLTRKQLKAVRESSPSLAYKSDLFLSALVRAFHEARQRDIDVDDDHDVPDPEPHNAPPAPPGLSGGDTVMEAPDQFAQWAVGVGSPAMQQGAWGSSPVSASASVPASASGWGAPLTSAPAWPPPPSPPAARKRRSSNNPATFAEVMYESFRRLYTGELQLLLPKQITAVRDSSIDLEPKSDFFLSALVKSFHRAKALDIEVDDDHGVPDPGDHPTWEAIQTPGQRVPSDPRMTEAIMTPAEPAPAGEASRDQDEATLAKAKLCANAKATAEAQRVRRAPPAGLRPSPLSPAFPFVFHAKLHKVAPVEAERACDDRELCSDPPAPKTVDEVERLRALPLAGLRFAELLAMRDMLELSAVSNAVLPPALAREPKDVALALAPVSNSELSAALAALQAEEQPEAGSHGTLDLGRNFGHYELVKRKKIRCSICPNCNQCHRCGKTRRQLEQSVTERMMSVGGVVVEDMSAEELRFEDYIMAHRVIYDDNARGELIDHVVRYEAYKNRPWTSSAAPDAPPPKPPLGVPPLGVPPKAIFGDSSQSMVPKTTEIRYRAPPIPSNCCSDWFLGICADPACSKPHPKALFAQRLPYAPHMDMVVVTSDEPASMRKDSNTKRKSSAAAAQLDGPLDVYSVPRNSVESFEEARVRSYAIAARWRVYDMAGAAASSINPSSLTRRIEPPARDVVHSVVEAQTALDTADSLAGGVPLLAEQLRILRLSHIRTLEALQPQV